MKFFNYNKNITKTLNKKYIKYLNSFMNRKINIK